jgi:hypothetical protein
MDSGGISAVLFAILFVLVSAAYAHKLYTEGAFTSGTSVDLSFLSLLVLYFPNTLFAYGFIADLMNGKYHYSIASLTALGGMITNKLVGGYVVDAIMYVLSFLAAQFARLSSGIQAVVATAAVVGTAAVAGPTAVAAAPALEVAAMATPAAAVAAAPAIAPAAAAAAVGTAAAATLPPPPDIEPLPPGTTVPPPMQGGATDLCSLPGFEWLENKIAPQGIVMSMTVLWYLMIELWDTGAGPQSMALGITTAITFGLQWLVLQRSNCLLSYKYGTYSAIIALVMGITFAGTSYGIQKQISKYTGGTSSGSGSPPTPETFVCPTGTVLNTATNKCVVTCPTGTVLNPTKTQCIPSSGGFGSSKGETLINVGGPNEKNQAVNDDDQFVCEAYKDGELVTSTIVQ